MKRSLALALLLALRSTAAFADAATAAAAFRDAEAAKKAGKWEDACRLYDASYQADAQLGALLNLGECNDHLGKTATAWANFTDAIDLAHSKHDPREARIKKRADDLAPKLARVHVDLPKSPPPNLAIKRDTVDITALAGTDVPVDPGAHVLAVTAPNFQPWQSDFTATPSKITTLAIPELQKIIVAPPIDTLPPIVTPPPIDKPVVHEGRVKIHSQPDAEIFVDGTRVGKGDFEGPVKGNGHTVRIVAPHMRPYQSELFVADGETRAIDIPLEKEAAASTTTVVIHERGVVDEHPTFEVAASLLSGVKLREERPLVEAARVELGLRLGHHVNFGFYAEAGTIDTAQACGFSMPGATPSTPFDFGPRNQFTSCTYLMPGLQLYIHPLRDRSAIDPYFGISPGFRFGFVSYNPFINGSELLTRTDTFPAIVSGARVGVDYHPLHDPAKLLVGAFVEGEVTFLGQEAANDNTDNPAENAHFVSLFGGLHVAVQL